MSARGDEDTEATAEHGLQTARSDGPQADHTSAGETIVERSAVTEQGGNEAEAEEYKRQQRR